MAKKLYVGGLAWATTDDSLRNYFAGAGTVTSASVVTDRDTGRSRGFGFVEMATDEEAQNAISMFNNKEFEGRTLRVNEAQPREAGNGAGGAGGFRGGNRGGFGGGSRGGFGGGSRY